jgi:hypothetical protein
LFFCAAGVPQWQVNDNNATLDCLNRNKSWSGRKDLMLQSLAQLGEHGHGLPVLRTSVVLAIIVTLTFG